MKLKISTQLSTELKIMDKEKLKDIYTFEKKENMSLIVIKNKRLVHSKYSIENEAKNSLKDIDKNTKAIIFYGFGLSYIVKYFIDNIQTFGLDEDIVIIAVVNDIYLFDYFCNNVDSSTFENIFFVSEKDSANFIFSILANNNIFNFKFITLQSLTIIEKEEALNYKNRILSLIQTSISDIFTRLSFENLWIKNIIFNTLYLANSADISVLKNSAKYFNALLICAGPTLQNSIEKIKKERENLIIIAVDTAYSILAKNNIEADFIITADAGFYNAFDFIYERGNFNYLVMDLITNKKIPTIVNSRVNMLTFSSTKALSIVGDIEKNMDTVISELFLGSTVATAMLDFAYFLGFNKVLLIGFDNSYPYYYRHSKHALSYEYKINNTNRLDTIESYHFESIKNSSDISSYPPTSYVLNNQIEYLSKSKNRYKDMQIMRFQSDAIDIENILYGDVLDVSVVGSRENALSHFNKLYKRNIIKKDDIKNYYANISLCLSDYNKKLYELYNELILSKCEANIIENRIYSVINAYSRKLPIIENILNTVTTISKLKNFDIMFVITEAIKTTNYFNTRINIILEKLKQ